jgi:adenylate cyclase
MKKVFLNPWMAAITLLLVLVIRVLDPSFIESVRLRYFDQLVTSQPVQDIPVNVVNIDEQTLDRFGQFPFPRDIYAKIIRTLYDRGAGLVVFNVLMPEPDRFNKDADLALTIEKNPVVLPTLGHTKQKNTSREHSATVVGQDPSDRIVEYPGLIANVERLERAAAGVGIVNTFPEIDGVVRRTPLIIMSQEKLYPSLALETLRVAAGDNAFQVKIGDEGIDAVRVPKFGKITTDALGRIWIDWSQRAKQYSLAQLPETFNGEIVIVGVSAAGLVNPIATARGEVWPQDVQAAVLGTMLSGTTIQRPEWIEHGEIVALLVAGFLVIFLGRWTYAFIPVIAMLVSAHFIVLHMYAQYHYLIDITWFVCGTGLVYAHAYTVKFVSEFLQKQQIRKQFQSYLSPDLVAKLIKDPSLLKLGGEEKELSILFSDVRGFTSISEHYGKDVQGLTKIMNRYMTAMTRKILENDGTLDKYIGDAQMAFWNAPLDETQHCKDAVKAALEMLTDLRSFNEEISKEGIPAFGMGLGINTGVVVVGNMGSEQRFDYTCLGDAVNLASRLEGQSKNYGVDIVLGPITAERLGDTYFTVHLDKIAVKGKKQGVDIYTVFYNPKDADAAEWKRCKKIHNNMLNCYREKNWDLAASLIPGLKGAFNGGLDHYYAIWLERIEEMRVKDLPNDWDGTYYATGK